ncbi:hypothetical protein M0804_007203 [Polistes exclamans]|nr:hypothetical protein M0804_007203 [Polistes exclamans]
MREIVVVIVIVIVVVIVVVVVVVVLESLYENKTKAIDDVMMRQSTFAKYLQRCGQAQDFVEPHECLCWISYNEQ